MTTVTDMDTKHVEQIPWHVSKIPPKVTAMAKWRKDKLENEKTHNNIERDKIK